MSFFKIFKSRKNKTAEPEHKPATGRNIPQRKFKSMSEKPTSREERI